MCDLCADYGYGKKCIIILADMIIGITFINKYLHAHIKAKKN